MSPNPDWMEEVATAGGWDEHALKVIKEMKSIKKEEWNVINDTLKTLEQFKDVNTVEFFTSNLTESISLKFEEIVAPLKNEWNDLLNTLLEPFMPAIQGVVNTLLPILQTIGDAVEWIMTAISLLNIPALTPPPEEGVMMTQAQFEAQYFRDHPLAHPPPGALVVLYQEYVDAWIAAHTYTPYTDRGYQID